VTPAPRPEPFRIRTPLVELAGLEYGPRDARAVVLLHGMRDLAWSLDPVARALCDRFRVLAFDLRGHGDSEKPRTYTLAHFVADLHAALATLDVRHCVLVGHSFGGEIASQYAALFPERVAACVLIEGLGAPFAPVTHPRARRERARRAIESLGAAPEPERRVPDLAAAFERLRRNHPRLDTGRARLLARAGTLTHSGGGLRWKWDPAVSTVWATMSRDEIEERWSWIECPVLCVLGEISGDTWWSGRSAARQELARRLALFADVTCVEIPGAGHMVHFDQPERLNRELERFLALRLPGAQPPAAASDSSNPGADSSARNAARNILPKA